MSKDIICWWPGGITSAVACNIAINLYGKDRCRVILIDTHNEHEDTYRFKKDCEKWYGKEIETISAIGDTYESIEEVWIRNKSLNTAGGAVCSDRLKRKVREKWERRNEYEAQVFGFEFSTNEFKRATSMRLNNEKINPIFPLLMFGLDKKACLSIVEKAGIKIPEAYNLGFHNNNCLGKFGGCVQGGIGYWKKIQKERPDLFEKRAELEHKLTDLKGVQVTMLRDQSKSNMERANGDKTLQRVFLKKHPDYPNNKTIDDLKGREVKPLIECNGFCGVNDLLPNSNTIEEINYELDL
jgi:hypothetical protein